MISCNCIHFTVSSYAVDVRASATHRCATRPGMMQCMPSTSCWCGVQGIFFLLSHSVRCIWKKLMLAFCWMLFEQGLLNHVMTTSIKIHMFKHVFGVFLVTIFKVVEEVKNRFWKLCSPPPPTHTPSLWIWFSWTFSLLVVIPLNWANLRFKVFFSTYCYPGTRKMLPADWW